MKEKFDEEMSHMRSFSAGSDSSSRRAVSPIESSMRLYAKGMDKVNKRKIVASNKDLSKIDSKFTFRPMLNINSTKIARRRHP